MVDTKEYRLKLIVTKLSLARMFQLYLVKKAEST